MLMQLVGVRFEFFGVNLSFVGQPVQGLRDLQFRAGAVNFGAVAGGQNSGFALPLQGRTQRR